MKKYMIGLTATFMIILAGCSSESKKETTSNSQIEISEVITITDSDGDEIEFDKVPEKVVVFDMAALDTINVLGNKDNVIGVPTSSLPKYLDEFKDVESVGGIKEPDLEKINALNPDLIIISGRQQDMKKSLSAIAPTVYLEVDNDEAWESTITNIETLATIFEKTELAQEQIDSLNTERDELKALAQDSKKNGLISLINEGSLSIYGPGSRFGIIYEGFGLIPADNNIEVSTHGQEVSYEYLLDINPDILFVVDRTQAIGGDSEKNKVAENPLVKKTTAGKDNKVINLTSDVWYLSSGGIEATQLMIKEVAVAYK